MLFEPYNLAGLTLANRIVMAPMTRSRAVERNQANALMAQYYGQRASAGLIITEGVSPSPNGLGYARIPGLFDASQVPGWSAVAEAVHAGGGRIFMQLMHTGRIAHLANLPQGARVVGPMATPAPGQIWTDRERMQDHSTPQALDEAGIAATVAEFAQAARLAMQAGLDGVELHGANGYLIEQFLNANVNQRTDGYGGGAAQRNRFALEVVDACVQAIGAQRVGIRVSPYGVFNGTGAFDGVEEQFLALARELAARKLAYLHLVDHSAMGAPALPEGWSQRLREAFGGTFIAVGGFQAESAEARLQSGQADLCAFGRPFIANPDLVQRLRTGAALATPDSSTFYTAEARGYTDYPALG